MSFNRKLSITDERETLVTHCLKTSAIANSYFRNIRRSASLMPPQIDQWGIEATVSSFTYSINFAGARDIYIFVYFTQDKLFNNYHL